MRRVNNTSLSQLHVLLMGNVHTGHEKSKNTHSEGASIRRESRSRHVLGSFQFLLIVLFFFFTWTREREGGKNTATKRSLELLEAPHSLGRRGFPRVVATFAVAFVSQRRRRNKNAVELVTNLCWEREPHPSTHSSCSRWQRGTLFLPRPRSSVGLESRHFVVVVGFGHCNSSALVFGPGTKNFL